MIKRYNNGSIRATGEDANNIIRHLRGDDEVELFNSQYSVGDTVTFIGDDGTEFTDIVKAPASIMGGHTAMAWLEVKGSYLLSRIVNKGR